ncbi:MAG: tyrosine-type recombinase/integrase [Microcoleaceae cyanobacterium]
MTKSKAPRYKGKVGVSSSNGSLRLSLPRALFEGKQRYLPLGLRDTPENREIAQLKAYEIELDVKLNRFDFTLKRYKPQSVSVSNKKKSLSLVELYKRFMRAKKPIVRPGTFRGGYVVMFNHLKGSPFAETIPDTDETGFAQGLADWAIAKLSADTAKRLLVQLNACIEWAIASRLVQLKESPFKGMASRTVGRKASRSKREIESFTLQERNAIISHYKSHSQYSHYALFVAFCFFVGCRPSEAIALQRENISPDLKQVTFTHAVVNGEQGRQRIKGLKTQEKRPIHTSQSARQVLKEALSCSTSKIVFPGVKGGLLGYKAFRQSWRIILAELGIEYRTPYYMRHTFVTLCLEAKVNVKDVAKAVGNSPEMIYRHYAENLSKFVIPDL